MRAVENSVVLNAQNMPISRVSVNTIFYTYDGDGQLIRKRIVNSSGEEFIYNFTHSEDGNVTSSFRIGEQNVVSHSRNDSFGRKIFDELQLGRGFLSRQFAYHEGDYTENHVENSRLRSSPVTELVSMITLTGGRTIGYEYDAEDRITKVYDSIDGETSYEYDALGQLVSENGARITYDNFGNISTKGGAAYQYNHPQWRDLLTSVGGQSISYDANGNPTNYLGNALTWEKGRQLRSLGDVQFTYNASGIRTSKQVGSIRFDYILEGTQILRKTWVGHTLIPLYDNENSVCGIIFNQNTYYFHKNLQGDVIAIADQTGSVVANYKYDAWGVPTIVSDTSGENIAGVNPFRYRGYYYDTQTKLYYLQSRYYDPVVGRFINADAPEIIAGNDDFAILEYNLFTYCLNDPVNICDKSGFSFFRDLNNAVGTAARNVSNIILSATRATTNTAVGRSVGKSIASNIPSIRKLMNGIGSNVGNVVAGAARNVGNSIRRILTSITTFFRNSANRIGRIARNRLNEIGRVTTKVVSSTVIKLNKIIRSLPSAARSAVASLPKSLAKISRWIGDNLDVIIHIVGGVLTIAGAIVGVVGLFVTLPAWLPIAAAVVAIVGVVIFIWQTIRMFS